MTPRPMMPNCAVFTAGLVVGMRRSLVADAGFRGGGLRHRFLDQRQQAAEALLYVASEINANCPAAARRQRLEIAQRLGLLEHAEGELLAGDLDVIDVLGGDLEEHAAIGTALV